MSDAPPSWGGYENGAPGDGPGGKDIVWFSDIDPIEPKFVEYPLIQAAMFHLLAGKPGVGKGALCARWIARCTNGEMYGTPRRALWLSSEEDAPRFLRPRLDVAGADITKVALIPDEFMLPRDVDWLRELLEREQDVGLVVIDPVSNHIERGAQVEEEVRHALQPLSRLAGDVDVPMIGSRHVSTKDGRGNFIGRILGATGFIGVARAVIGVAKDYDGTVHVRTMKANYVPEGEAGLRFRLEGVSYDGWGATVVKAVEDGPSAVDLDELVTMVNRQAIGAGSELAREALLRVLRENGGIMESSVLDAAVADETGITARAVRNLRSEPHDRGWISYHPDDTGERRVWMVSLTNAAPWPDDEKNESDALKTQRVSPLDTATGTTTPSPDRGSQETARAREAPDVQLGSGSEQELSQLHDGSQESQADVQLPLEADVQLPEADVQLICPTCGSSDIFAISGRCKTCGSKVREHDLG